jgi:hypothetical protein
LQGDEGKEVDLFILIATVLCVLLFIWAKYMYVILDNDGITYRVIFKKRSIAWKDIQQTNLGFEFHGHSGDFAWNFTAIDKKQINFSAGYFSKKSNRQIAEAVVEKCPAHIVAGEIKNISEGKFPWYVF